MKEDTGPVVFRRFPRRPWQGVQWGGYDCFGALATGPFATSEHIIDLIHKDGVKSLVVHRFYP